MVDTSHGQITALNDELVAVRLKKQYVEKYRQKNLFGCIGDTEKGELTAHIAPIVSEYDKDEMAKRFDNFIYGLMLANMEALPSFKYAKKQLCDKQIVSKQFIEDRVVEECLKLLTEDNIKFIAKQIADECNKSTDNQTIKQLKKAIHDADTAIENLWKGIEQGQSVQMLTERLNKRQAEREELEIQLAIEMNKRITLSEGQILAFLDYVCEMPIEDINKKRALINIFVHSVYLYDDHFTLIVNASNKPLSIDHIPLEDIHTTLESLPPEEQCSTLENVAPP